MKENLSPGTKLILLPVFISLICIMGMTALWQQAYRRASFTHLSGFCQVLAEENPAAEQEILSSLKKYQANPGGTAGKTWREKISYQDLQEDYLAQYGYRYSDFGENRANCLLWISAAALVCMTWGFLFAFRRLDQRNRKRIEELTEYLERINMGMPGGILQRGEDEFSLLQDQIYKVVTGLYQTREAAVMARQEFAENLANIAHQLKTPITASLLSLQLMDKAVPNTYGKQVKRQLERLNYLEESLLTLSKIDAGVLGLEAVPVDVYTVLSLAAENLSGLLEKAGVSVSIPEKGCMEVTGDLEWTMEALMNLMKNCMEHSPEGGTIFCDYSQNPLYSEIRIWDQGEGFAPEDIPHLFQRFYRGKRDQGEGIGIGLSLARSIIELENGIVTARNLPEGGACFEIRIYRH